MVIHDWAFVQTRPTQKQLIVGALDIMIQGLSFAALATLVFMLYILLA